MMNTLILAALAGSAAAANNAINVNGMLRELTFGLLKLY